MGSDGAVHKPSRYGRRSGRPWTATAATIGRGYNGRIRRTATALEPRVSRVAEQIDRDVLGGLAVFRNQDSRSILVTLSSHVLLIDERVPFFLETVPVSLRVLDELLREENVAGFGERLNAGRNDNDVGNFRVLRALEGRVELPEAAMRAHSHLQIVSGRRKLAAQAPRGAQQPSRASIGQHQMVAGGRIRIVQIAGELPEEIPPIFVEGLRTPGDLDDILAVAADVADGDEPDAFFGPPFELVADDIVLVQLLEKPDVTPSDEVAKRWMDEIGLGVRQDMNLAERDVADGGELLHKPSWIVPVLLDSSN